VRHREQARSHRGAAVLLAFSQLFFRFDLCPGRSRGQELSSGLDGSIFPMKKVSTFYGMWTLGVSSLMKSQDIFLLFKMASLHAQEEKLFG
jgi:hypothetical protein